MTQIIERPPVTATTPTSRRCSPRYRRPRISPWCRRSTGRCTTRWRPTTGCWCSARTWPSSAACSGSPRASPKPSAKRRCFDTPLAESAIIGIAIGLAIRGFVPVPEIQFDGFSLPGVRPDGQPPGEVPDAHARRRRHAGHHPDPVVRRNRCGRTSFGVHRDLLGAHRGPESGGAVDSVGRVLAAAAFDRQPGSGRLPGAQAAVLVARGRRHQPHPACPSAARRYAASATTSPCSPTAGWSRPRWRQRIWRPTSTAGTWRSSTCARSTRSTSTPSRRRCARPGAPWSSCTRAPRTLGFGAELAARIQEELFYDLEAPVLRATGFDTPYPPARLEKLWLPGVDRLIDCVEKAMSQP